MFSYVACFIRMMHVISDMVVKMDTLYPLFDTLYLLLNKRFVCNLAGPVPFMPCNANILFVAFV